MRKTLLAVDGNSLLYRAFYAMPPFTTKNGEPAGAVYGFFSMLLSALDTISPDAILIAFDKKGKTFRHNMYDEYKGTRKPMPEDLIPQVPMLKKALTEMGITILEMEGYEADDILGAMSKVATDSELKSVLLTGDKDSFQLVDDNCSVLLTRKGVSETVIVDENKLYEMYELTPSQIVDLKGFMGDSSDNIPGVPGVGEKTALKLLHQYGNMDGVYEHIEEIKGKLKEKLLVNKEIAYLSRELATIQTNIELGITIDDVSYYGLEEETTKPVFEGLGFNSLVKRLGYQKTVKKEIRNITIEDIDTLKTVLADISKADLISIILGDNISIAYSEEEQFTIICEHSLLNVDFTREIVIGELKGILENYNIPKVMFGAKDTAHMLKEHGITLSGLFFDIKLAEYVIDPASANTGLNKLVERYELTGSSAAMLSIYKQQERKLKKNNLWYVYNNIEMPLLHVLLGMENTGFKIDFDLLDELSDSLEKRVNELTESIYEACGYDDFNINSTKQLGQVLFERLGLPVIKKTKTGYSTSNEVLEKLYDKHPVIDYIIKYRQLAKLKSTYIDGLKEIADNNGFVHTTFVQVSTVTGRISSKEPNLQNIPIRTEEGREIRRLFLPSEKGRKLITSDYSQIELRILAAISDDTVMKQAFEDGVDIHTRTASEIFEVPLSEVTDNQRRDAKAVNFGIVYGISDFGLSRNMNISVKRAGSYIKRYFERFSGVKRYMDEIKLKAKQDGYVTTLLGRRRYLPELKSSNFNIRSFGERAALNTPIQGTAADIIKLAMIDVYNKLSEGGYKSKLILQVHDELIIDTAEDEIEAVKMLIKECMENAYELDVPLLCDIGIGDNWLEAK